MRRVVGLCVAGCSGLLLACGGSDSVPLGEMESGIKSDYQLQVTKQATEADAGNVKVNSVQCVRKGDDGARCFADLSGAVDTRQGITVTIDGDKYLWEADGNPVAASATQEPAPSDQAADEPTVPGTDGPEQILDKLKKAGLDVAEMEPTQTEKAFYEVSLKSGGKVAIYVFGGKYEAAGERSDLRALEADSPSQVEVKRIGATVMVGTVEEPAKLDDAEFQRVVTAVDG